MGNTSSTTFSTPKSSKSSTDLSVLLWTLQISDDVVKDRGQVKADGYMGVKIGNKRISVSKPSKVFWVGVLLEKNGWIHTGIGLHNDVTVTFETGTTKTYDYLVAHGVADSDKKFKVHLSFGNNLHDIHTSLADAFDTKVDYSFSPVFAGDSWQTLKIAEDMIKKMEYFLGRTFKMTAPSYGETNCVHFSVAMYLFFADKEEKIKELLRKMSSEIDKQDYKLLLKNIKTELDKISF